MNRLDAFFALFGSNELTEEVFDQLSSQVSPTDDEEDEIAEDDQEVLDRIFKFLADPDDYIKTVTDSERTALLERLKVHAGQPAPAPAPPVVAPTAAPTAAVVAPAAATPAVVAPVATTPAAPVAAAAPAATTVNLLNLPPAPRQAVGGDASSKKPRVAVGEVGITASSSPPSDERGKKKKHHKKDEGDQNSGRDRAPEPPPIRTASRATVWTTPTTRTIMITPDWIRMRGKIEEAFRLAREVNPITNGGLQRVAGLTASAQRYANGKAGPQRVAFGRFLLALIRALHDQLDIVDPARYAEQFVHGRTPAPPTATP